LIIKQPKRSEVIISFHLTFSVAESPYIEVCWNGFSNRFPILKVHPTLNI
jgi:hypothetical protein